MAKKKKGNKVGLAKKPSQSKSRVEMKEKESNPFELHFNKIKRDAIGRKQMKCEVGKPSKSRDEAFKKRKQTLLQEYIHKDKSGKGVVDRRIKDDADGGFGKRKAKVYEIKMGKSSVNPELTHKGKGIDTRIDDKPDNSDDEYDQDMNLLSRADYIENAHFGGGDNGPERTQAEFMLEVLQEKDKRRKEKEENLDLTEKLDEDLNELRNLIQPGAEPPLDTDKDVDTKEEKSYDVLFNELRFKPDRRAKTTNAIRRGANDEDADERINDSNPRSSRKRKEKELVDAGRHIPEPKSKNFVILPLIEPKVDLKLKLKSTDETKRLKKQVKREMKGAQRELRKDNRFMKQVKINEIREADAERKRKVNRIIADLASDLHDFKKSKK